MTHDESEGSPRAERPPAAATGRDEAKRRLARAGDVGGPEDRARRALQERARALATRAPVVARRLVPAVAIDAGEGRYALVADGVRRVERAPAPARLPGSPPFALGLVSLGGRPWMLLDVASLLGDAPPRTAPARWAVLLAEARAELAVAADAVTLFDLAPDALHPAGPPDGLRRGLTGDARVVLDAAALLRRALERLGAGGEARR